MNDMILNRGAHRPVGGLEVTAQMSLLPGRAHELCGAARRRLAVMVAGKCSGPVIWIRPGWRAEGLNPEGVLSLLDPGRLIFVNPIRAEDMLWCMEEALRSGVAPLVVAELPKLPGMTPVRRLHLAAETGAEIGRGRGMGPPLGLILSPGEGGAPGVESRWSLDPTHEAARFGWRLERRRARTLPPKVWELAG